MISVLISSTSFNTLANLLVGPPPMETQQAQGHLGVAREVSVLEKKSEKVTDGWRDERQ